MRKGILVSILVSYISLTNAYATTLEQTLQSVIQSQLPSAQVGFLVMEAKSGKVFAEHQSQKNFTPASNMKLLSSYAALKALGPEFRYQTHLYQTGHHWGLRFSGDPSLRRADLVALFQRAKQAGLNEFTGNLIVDDTQFSDEPYAAGWMQDDLQWGYAAPISTLSLDENAAILSITPGQMLNQPASLKLKSSNHFPNLKVTASVNTVSPEDAKHRCHLSVQSKGLHYHFTGCWPIDLKDRSLSVAIRAPRERFAALVPMLFQQAGIPFKGKVIFEPISTKQAKLIATHRSPPLTTLLNAILADSNNQYADALTKSLGLQTLNEGSFQAGVAAMKSFLKPTGINLQQMSIKDGSGLSYYNQLTPHLLTRLLHHIYQDEPTKTIFMESLPVSGESGSLKYRMPAKSLTGKVKAKTGTFTGTSNLSGFLKTQNNNDIIFSIMVNDASAERATLDQFITDICYLLVFHPETNRGTRT